MVVFLFVYLVLCFYFPPDIFLVTENWNLGLCLFVFCVPSVFTCVTERSFKKAPFFLSFSFLSDTKDYKD